MYTDIIIGFDGSARGYDALALGRQLARATAATTTVVCVHPYQALTADITDAPAVDLSWRLGAEKVLEGAHGALDDMPGVTFRAMAETSVARALHAVALEAAAALIIVGSTRRRGLGRLLPGSTADQVIHAAPCAVAVAPAGYATRARGRRSGFIGAAVDGGPETERMARIGATIARGASADLRLLAVAETHKPTSLAAARLGSPSVRDVARAAAQNALDRAVAAAGAGVKIEPRLLEGTPALALAAESNDLDLLLVGSRGYGPLRRIALGTVTSGVLRDAACPVLALPRGTPEEIDASVARIVRAAHR